MKRSSLSGLAWDERLTFVKSIPFDEKDFRSKGTKFQIIKFKPKTEVAPHFHRKRVEMFYVVKGSGLIKMNGKRFRTKPDDFFLCERGDVHQFINDTAKDFVVLVFRTNDPGEKDMLWEK